MDYYEIAKIILVLSASFAIVGIAVQIIRLLQQVISSFRDVKEAVAKVETLVDKATNDYSEVLGTIRSFGGLGKQTSIFSIVVTVVMYAIEKFRSGDKGSGE